MEREHMTLPVAFPSQRDTGSCVRREQAVLCSASVLRSRWWQGQAGLASSCQRGTVRWAGSFPRQYCGACPPVCCSTHRLPFSTPNVSARGGRRAMQAGFVFPRCGVSERSAWIIHSSSACCSYWIPRVSGHPARTRWRIHCCAWPGVTPRRVCSGERGRRRGGWPLVLGSPWSFVAAGRWDWVALRSFRPWCRWVLALSLLEGLLAGLPVFISVSALQPSWSLPGLLGPNLFLPSLRMRYLVLYRVCISSLWRGFLCKPRPYFSHTIWGFLLSRIPGFQGWLC